MSDATLLLYSKCRVYRYQMYYGTCFSKHKVELCKNDVREIKRRHHKQVLCLAC